MPPICHCCLPSSVLVLSRGFIQSLRQRKYNLFLHAVERTHAASAQLLKSLDQRSDEYFGCRRTGSHAHSAPVLQPCRVELIRVIDEIGWHAEPLCHLAQSVRIGTILAAHDN